MEQNRVKSKFFDRFSDFFQIETLLGLILASSWISQTLMDMFIIILAFVVVKRFKINENDCRSVFVHLKFPLIISVIYFVVAVLGYIFNASPEAKMVENLSRFTWVLNLMLFSFAFFFVSFDQKVWLKFFSFAFLFPAIFSLNIYFNNGTDLIHQRLSYNRVVGFVNSATYHGHIGGFIFVALFMLIIFNRKSLSRLKIATALSCLMIVGLSAFLTMTRGVWISSFISIIFFMLFTNWKKTLIILTSMLFLATIYIVFFAKQNILKRADSDTCRKQLIAVHINMIKAAPWLGIGYRDNMRDLKPYWPIAENSECLHLREDGTHAHNQFLNSFATTGFLGFLCFSTLWFYFVFVSLKNWKQSLRLGLINESNLSLALVTFILYFTLGNMTETNFEYSKVRLSLLLIWSLIICTNINLTRLTKK